MFTSCRIAFLSASQYYTVWCEHNFLSIFMLSMSSETLNIILICFDGKKQPIWKIQKRKYSSSNNKKMPKESKVDFFWIWWNAVASFKLGVDLFEIWTKVIVTSLSSSLPYSVLMQHCEQNWTKDHFFADIVSLCTT